MNKVRCGDHTGFDLDKVIAWSKGRNKNDEFLLLHFSGCEDGFLIARKGVGAQADKNLFS